MNQQLCNIILLFHNGSRLYDKKMKVIKMEVFSYVLKNIRSPLKGQLIRSNSVLMCMCFRISRYVAAPQNPTKFSQMGVSVFLIYNYLISDTDEATTTCKVHGPL